MNAVLTGLPLPDDVKTALTGGGNDLAALLDVVDGYEQGGLQRSRNKAPMNCIPPQQLVSFYLAAHNGPSAWTLRPGICELSPKFGQDLYKNYV